MCSHDRICYLAGRNIGSAYDKRDVDIFLEAT